MYHRWQLILSNVPFELNPSKLNFCFFLECFHLLNSIFSERMSASECMEHHWLSGHISLRLLSATPSSNDQSQIQDFKNNTTETSSSPAVTSVQNAVNCSKTYSTCTQSNGDDSRSTDSCHSDKDFKSTEITNSKCNNDSDQIIPAATTSSSSVTNRNHIFRVNETNEDGICGSCDMISRRPASPSTTSLSPSSFFPDAPTTPKVCRKSSPDSTSNVKALVKKFQLDGCQDATALKGAVIAINNTTTPTTPVNGTCVNDNSIEDTNGYCCSSSRCGGNCIPCGGPGCRHINPSDRKPIVIDQGIIC